MTQRGFERRDVSRFGRNFFRSPDPVTRIGDGELGGKARGLYFCLVTARDNSSNQVTKFPLEKIAIMD